MTPVPDIKLPEFINLACQVTMAFCAIAAVLISLWAIPKKLSAKVAVMRRAFNIIAAILMVVGTNVAFFSPVGLAGSFLIAVSVLVQAIMIVTSDESRAFAIKTDLIVLMFSIATLVSSPIIYATNKLVQTQGEIIGLMEKSYGHTDVLIQATQQLQTDVDQLKTATSGKEKAAKDEVKQ